MLQFSHDPEAGTIYVYFSELEEGQASYVMEYPASVLLDGEGRVLGFSAKLDDEVLLSMLELALEGPFNWLDGEQARLIIRVADEGPARSVRLEQTAIFDLDDEDRILGVELALPEEFRTPEALARLAPHMVALDEAAGAGEGPVVFEVPEDEDADEPRATDNQDDLDEDEGDFDGDAGDLDEDDEGDADDFDGDAGDLDEDDDDLDEDGEGGPGQEEAQPELRGVGQAGGGPIVRSGFVALVGKPNVGKSTLLNALLGEKVAIVSPRPQTTRVPMRGILSRAGAQIIFIDTPGIHRPNHRLGRFMVDLAERTLPGADVIGFMVDISTPPSQLDRQIARQVMQARGRKLLILNKVDQRPRQGQTFFEEYRALGEWEMELAVSARRQLGLSTLLEEIVARLPEGPALYPEAQLTDRSEQQLAAEFVREKVLYMAQDEVPHAVAVEVDEWEEREHATYMRMTINVEREGQKAIVIGAGGAMLKKIGSAARQDIERLLGRPVYLDLWVKVRPNWRDDPSALGWLGYRARDFQ